MAGRPSCLRYASKKVGASAYWVASPSSTVSREPNQPPIHEAGIAALVQVSPSFRKGSTRVPSEHSAAMRGVKLPDESPRLSE